MSDTPKNRSIVCCFCGDFWSYVEGVSDRDALIKIASEHEATCASNPYTTKIEQLERELAEARSMTEGQWLLKVAARLVTAGCKSDGIVDAMDELIQQRDSLAEAAQAVVDRWDAPTWKDLEPTAKFMNALRKAIAAAKGGEA
jgi:hypothetical protein